MHILLFPDYLKKSVLSVYVRPAQLNLFSFCFPSYASVPSFVTNPVVVLLNVFFFNCQQMYYKWCRAAERLVVCTVLMAVTLLSFINVLLGKNKLNKVSWLSFGHLFPTHSLSAAWFFCGFLPGRFSRWENGDLVIMGIREIRGILSDRTWDCTLPSALPAAGNPCCI